MNSEPLVDVQNLSKVFHTKHFFSRNEETDRRAFYMKRTVNAARSIDFQIKRGEVFGLLGPNGAGKTTTVKMICGLVRPCAGRVMIDGLHVEKKRLKALRKLGVVLEGTRTVMWPLTPLENLSYFGSLRDVARKDIRERSRALLEFVGLKEKMNVQVRKLSRGQKQKLAICIALISDPDVLLLDEPTTGLDVQSSRTIKDSIHRMTREHGKSVLVTTHDMHVAQEVCDRIGIINQGKLVACKPTGELLEYFSDQTYVFRLDAPIVGTEALRTFGAEVSSQERSQSDTLANITVPQELDGRSEALYATFDALRTEGRKIIAVEHQKQTLESVFLRLTAGEKKEGA